MGSTSWAALALVGGDAGHCTDFDERSAENEASKRKLSDVIMQVMV